MSGIWAKSVLASRHAITGARLDTTIGRLPKQLLAELNTHRRIGGILPASSNAASSRAIPVSKIIQQVIDDPYVPVKWTKNQSGMQGYEELDEFSRGQVRTAWFLARDHAVNSAQFMANNGAHKQIINRLLEPWMWAIVVMSATEWENFRKLRDHHAAEPAMQEFAKAVGAALDGAEVQTLQPGEWHLPFIADDDWYAASDFVKPGTPEGEEVYRQKVAILQPLSVARCASTSYKTVDGFDMTLKRAQKLYDGLLGDPLHASPFEHVAQADFLSRNYGFTAGDYDHPEDHRNFTGFRQLRAFVEREAA